MKFSKLILCSALFCCHAVLAQTTIVAPDSNVMFEPLVMPNGEIVIGKDDVATMMLEDAGGIEATQAVLNHSGDIRIVDDDEASEMALTQSDRLTTEKETIQEQGIGFGNDDEALVNIGSPASYSDDDALYNNNDAMIDGDPYASQTSTDDYDAEDQYELNEDAMLQGNDEWAQYGFGSDDGGD